MSIHIRQTPVGLCFGQAVISGPPHLVVLSPSLKAAIRRRKCVVQLHPRCSQRLPDLVFESYIKAVDLGGMTPPVSRDTLAILLAELAMDILRSDTAQRP